VTLGAKRDGAKAGVCRAGAVCSHAREHRAIPDGRRRFDGGSEAEGANGTDKPREGADAGWQPEASRERAKSRHPLSAQVAIRSSLRYAISRS
jgi:hypothetical protein